MAASSATVTVDPYIQMENDEDKENEHWMPVDTDPYCLDLQGLQGLQGRPLLDGDGHQLKGVANAF